MLERSWHAGRTSTVISIAQIAQRARGVCALQSSSLHMEHVRSRDGAQDQEYASMFPDPVVGFGNETSTRSILELTLVSTCVSPVLVSS
jgi:hypothetical protein